MCKYGKDSALWFDGIVIVLIKGCNWKNIDFRHLIEK